jgi:Uma2 family endonuclease
MTGEIINGEVITIRMPSRDHAYTASALGSEVGPAYQFGRGGGPGGWTILDEPEISLGENILVLDLAGWKRERFPIVENHDWISAVPDWVCEVLSPSTVRKDKIKKMLIYGHHSIPFL